MGLRLPSKKVSTLAVVALGILNIIFAAAFAGVVATQLDYQQVKAGAPTVCLLNSKGQDCVFTYITAGAIMLFALLIIVPVLYLYRRGAPLYTVYFSLAAFSFFWQLVCALTITIRGDQAESAGLPKESSRRTAYAMSWIGVVLTLFQGIFVFLDMIREWQLNREVRKAESVKSMKIDVSVVHAGVGVGLV